MDPQTQSEQQTQPVVNQIPQQKNYLLLGVFVVIAALLGSGATYLALQSKTEKQPQPSPFVQATPTPTPDPTATWKTYINLKHGYSLKYPSEWSYTLGKGDEDQVVFENMTVVITVTNSTEKPAIKSDARNKVIENTQINIGGVTGEQATILDAPTDNVSYVQSAVIYNDKTYYFNLEGLDQKSVYDKMLSTFKFTDSTSAEGTFCGGIAAIECPRGYTCKLQGNFPDAGGKCSLLSF